MECLHIKSGKSYWFIGHRAIKLFGIWIKFSVYSEKEIPNTIYYRLKYDFVKKFMIINHDY